MTNVSCHYETQLICHFDLSYWFDCRTMGRYIWSNWIYKTLPHRIGPIWIMETLWYDTIQYVTIRFDMIWYDTVRYLCKKTLCQTTHRSRKNISKRLKSVRNYPGWRYLMVVFHKHKKKSSIRKRIFLNKVRPKNEETYMPVFTLFSLFLHYKIEWILSHETGMNFTLLRFFMLPRCLGMLFQTTAKWSESISKSNQLAYWTYD